MTVNLDELTVQEHTLDIDFQVVFLSQFQVSEATRNAIRAELQEHIAKALERRAYLVREVKNDSVVIS